MRAHIPSVWKEVSKSNLPWVDAECKAAISAKHAVEGTCLYEEVAARCIDTLRKARAVYLVKLKHDMQKLPRGSKRWWALNKQLMHRQSSPSLFPPLRNLAGQWCRSPESKADAFVETWTKKCRLSPETYDISLPLSVMPCLFSVPSVPGQLNNYLRNSVSTRPPVQMDLVQPFFRD